MTKELENLKKKILYRASYRGTKEMDILLSSFVKKYLNTFSKNELIDLEDFLNLEDQTILNYYNLDLKNKKIENNSISKYFKKFKV